MKQRIKESKKMELSHLPYCRCFNEEWRRFLGKEDCELIIEEDWVFVENGKEDEDGFMIVREMRWEYVRVREGGQDNLTIYSTFFLMV